MNIWDFQGLSVALDSLGLLFINDTFSFAAPGHLVPGLESFLLPRRFDSQLSWRTFKWICRDEFRIIIEVVNIDQPAGPFEGRSAWLILVFACLDAKAEKTMSGKPRRDRQYQVCAMLLFPAQAVAIFGKLELDLLVSILGKHD